MSQADAVSTRPLPPGVSEAGFARAVDAITAALGADKVLTSDADLREFRDPFQHATWDDYTASAVVMPTTVEEIQAIAPRRQRAQGPAVDARDQGATTATAAPRRACGARSS